jgi:hydrogenase maturation factor
MPLSSEATANLFSKGSGRPAQMGKTLVFQRGESRSFFMLHSETHHLQIRNKEEKKYLFRSITFDELCPTTVELLKLEQARHAATLVAVMQALTTPPNPLL